MKFNGVEVHAAEEQLAARLAAATDAARFPHLSAALAHVPAPHPEEHFEHGLRLLLAGITSRR